MPRYDRRQPRESRKDSKLNELAVLSQLYGTLSQPQQRAEESQRQNNLAILGLLNQMQGQEGQQSELKRYHDATIQQGQAELADKQVGRKADNDARIAAANASAGHGLINAISSRPEATIDDILGIAAANGIQGAEQIYGGRKQARTDATVGQLQSTIAPIYQMFGSKPEKAKEALNIVSSDPRLQQQDVATAMAPFWQQQNEALYKPEMPTSEVPQIGGSGIGGAIGSAVRQVPQLPMTIAKGLQAGESAMTDMGSNFWASILGLDQSKLPTKPDSNAPVRPWGPFSR